MHPKNHALWGFIVSLILINYFNVSDFNALIFWFSSWFIIDLDHAIRYAFLTKNINPFKFWSWSHKDKKRRQNTKSKKYPVFIFHGIEPILILLLLAFYIPILFYVILGFILHLFLDYLDLAKQKINIASKMSLIYSIMSNVKNK